MNAKIGNRNSSVINIMGLTLILITVVEKCVRHDYPEQRNFYIFLYLFFFGLWVITIQQRVIQKHTRVTLLSIASLELFWMLVRIIKYAFFKTEITMRYGWYLYYLPMLLIPALCLLLAVATGKPESDKPKKFLYAFPVLAIVLFVFVLTNDI